jgi:hypothetical protein
MIKINNTQPDFNDNILSNDFSFENILPWSFNNVEAIDSTIGTSDDIAYEGNKCLKAFHLNSNSHELETYPTDPDKYNFTTYKSGEHIFSFRTYIIENISYPLDDVSVKIMIHLKGNPVPTTILYCNIIQQEYVYSKWQTFFEKITLLGNTDYQIFIEFTNSGNYIPDEYTIYLDGFKLEYIQDRDFNIPTMYSKPIN